MNQNELFDQYIVNLTKWNKKMNLVQNDSLKNVFERHIKDSLQIQKFLNKNDYIVDIGSGAGFPGIVLSICGFRNIALCEKNFKKCIFLNEIKNKLGLDFVVYNGDIYELNVPRGTLSKTVAVSRAFGSLSKLLDVMAKLSIKRGVFHKGECFYDEIKEAELEFEFNYTKTQSITNEKSVILDINNIRRKKWQR